MPAKWGRSYRWCFRHPFMERDLDGFDDDEQVYLADLALTLVELRMIKLSYALRSKPMWWIKYKNPTIRAKWRDEALAQEILQGNLTEREVDYVLDELAEYETMRDDVTGAEPSCHTRIWQSDSLIPIDLRDRLASQIAILEDVPADKKDWHPRSDNQVLDLVHPSLYCLAYGRTLAYPPLDECPVEARSANDLGVIQGPQAFFRTKSPQHQTYLPKIEEYAISDKFAWIPTDFAISSQGETAEPLGYINNLHPSHTDLYASLSEVVARFSHLYNRVLTDMHPANDMLRRVTESYSYPDDEAPGPDYDSDDDTYQGRYDEWSSNRPLILPTVPEDGYEANTGALAKRKEEYSIHGRECQIIIKLANIHLTPEKPTYPGGSWHVEGMGNERIVASGIYYYSSDNITDSQLAFRTAVTFNHFGWYVQSDTEGVSRTFGLNSGGENNQRIGKISTSEGRCIAFPNIYQHRVSPFELADKTKPGHRKIIALFLVDPTLGRKARVKANPFQPKIPSTSIIPPQQGDWIRKALSAENLASTSLIRRLPLEIIDMIVKELQTQACVEEDGSTALQLGPIMTQTEAENYRVELMNERTAFVGAQDEKFFVAEFSMCEH